MTKILKYLSAAMLFVNALDEADEVGGAPVEIRPAYKKKKWRIA